MGCVGVRVGVRGGARGCAWGCVGAAAAGGWGAWAGGRRRRRDGGRAEPARGGNAAAATPPPSACGAWVRPLRAGGAVGMFHVKHTCNGLTFSNLQSQQNDVGYCTLPNLPQQYFAGAMATRLQM